MNPKLKLDIPINKNTHKCIRTGGKTPPEALFQSILTNTVGGQLEPKRVGPKGYPVKCSNN